MKTAVSFVLAIAVLGAVRITTTVMSSAITAKDSGLTIHPTHPTQLYLGSPQRLLGKLAFH